MDSRSAAPLIPRRSRAGTLPESRWRPRSGSAFWRSNSASSSACSSAVAAVRLRRLRTRSSSARSTSGTRRRAPTAEPGKLNVYVSRSNEIFSSGTPAAANRSITLLLDAPRHRADEPFRRRRRVGGADLQDLRHQRRIVGDPVPHDDPAAGPRHAHHLLGHVERLGREHRAEDADDEVEAVVLELVQIGRVALLEPEVGEAAALGARAFPASTRLLAMSTPRTSAPSLAAGSAVVPSPHPRSRTLSPSVIPSVVDERLAALAHALRDAREVALLPECLVRIHRSQSPFVPSGPESLKARALPTLDPRPSRNLLPSQTIAAHLAESQRDERPPEICHHDFFFPCGATESSGPALISARAFSSCLNLPCSARIGERRAAAECNSACSPVRMHRRLDRTRAERRRRARFASTHAPAPDANEAEHPARACWRLLSQKAGVPSYPTRTRCSLVLPPTSRRAGTERATTASAPAAAPASLCLCHEGNRPSHAPPDECKGDEGVARRVDRRTSARP